MLGIYDSRIVCHDPSTKESQWLAMNISDAFVFTFMAASSFRKKGIIIDKCAYDEALSITFHMHNQKKIVLFLVSFVLV